jgi:hypothetical protein
LDETRAHRPRPPPRAQGPLVGVAPFARQQPRRPGREHRSLCLIAAARRPGVPIEAGLVSTAGGLHNPVMSDDAVLNQELRSAIAARKELGDEMEPAVIDAFVERIGRRLADGADERERALNRRRDHQKEMVLGSMAISIPLLAIAAIFTGLQGVVVVCVALVVIAVVTAR